MVTGTRHFCVVLLLFISASLPIMATAADEPTTKYRKHSDLNNPIAESVDGSRERRTEPISPRVGNPAAVPAGPNRLPPPSPAGPIPVPYPNQH